MSDNLTSLFSPNCGSRSCRIPQALGEGSYSWAFGDTQEGIYGEFNVGEKGSIKRTVDLTGVEIISFAFKFRASPDGDFKFSLLIDAEVVYSKTIASSSEATEFVQRAANTSHLTGNHDLKLEVEVL